MQKYNYFSIQQDKIAIYCDFILNNGNLALEKGI
jgi:hypothetical protein